MALLLWTVVGVLMAVWSATVWLGQLLLAALLGSAGHLPLKGLTLPEAWTLWLPQGLSEAITQAIDAAQPLVQAVLQQMPALASGATALAWVVWAVGAGLLLAAGGASHFGLRWWQRSQHSPAPRATLIPS